MLRFTHVLPRRVATRTAWRRSITQHRHFSQTVIHRNDSTGSGVTEKKEKSLIEQSREKNVDVVDLLIAQKKTLDDLMGEVQAKKMEKVNWNRIPKFYWWFFAASVLFFAQEIYSYYTIEKQLDEVLKLLEMDEAMEEQMDEHIVPVFRSLERIAIGDASDVERYVARLHDSLELLKNMTIKHYMVQLLRRRPDVVTKLMNIWERCHSTEIKTEAAHVLFLLSKYEEFARDIVTDKNGMGKIHKQLLTEIFSSKYKAVNRTRYIEETRKWLLELLSHESILADISRSPQDLTFLTHMAQYDQPAWLSETALDCMERLTQNHISVVKQLGKQRATEQARQLLSENMRFKANLEFLVNNGRTDNIKQRASKVLKDLNDYSLSGTKIPDSGKPNGYVTKLTNYVVRTYESKDYISAAVFYTYIPFALAYIAKCYARKGAPKEIFFRKAKLVTAVFVFTDFVLTPIRFTYFSTGSPLCLENQASTQYAFEGWAALTAAIYGLHLYAWYCCPYINATYIFRFLPIFTVYDASNRIPYFTFTQTRNVLRDIAYEKEKQK